VATVRYPREGLEVEVPVGATLLEASDAAGAPHGDHCGRVCGCSTCHVYVLAGAERLSPMQRDEDSLLGGAIDRKASSRLGCQAVIETDGEVVLEITDESFETYLDEHEEDAERVLALRGLV